MFYDGLIEMRERHAEARLVGAETFLQRPVWHLRYRDNKGEESDVYVDRETKLLFAWKAAVPLHARGNPIPQVTIFGDWRPVSSVLLPHRVATFDLTSGREMQPLEVNDRPNWDSIIANFKYDEAYFSPRALRPTPIAKLVLDMFERAKTATPEQVLALYNTFKDTKDYIAADAASQLNWLGYELLKAGNLATGIAVLESVASEFPSANAYDSVGDALAQADRKAEAIVAYRRALALNPDATDTAFKLKKLTR
jgi:hypothetical protein